MEEIERNIKVEVPCGVLRWRDLEYYLLSPHPVARDWQTDNQQVFWVTPKKVSYFDNENGDVFPHPRHITVSTQLVMIEYSGWLPPIRIYEYRHFTDEE